MKLDIVQMKRWFQKKIIFCTWNGGLNKLVTKWMYHVWINKRMIGRVIEWPGEWGINLLLVPSIFFFQAGARFWHFNDSRGAIRIFRFQDNFRGVFTRRSLPSHPRHSSLTNSFLSHHRSFHRSVCPKGSPVDIPQEQIDDISYLQGGEG